MELKFKVAPAARCSKKDVITAIDIYCKSVDYGSLTDTNQINDYIWNAKAHNDEKRTMFFYLLYNQSGEVIGFSEFAYLPKNQTLVLDYLCTRKRNHLLFYNFYHMVLEEISTLLKKHGQFIRYIITELSLSQHDGKLIDNDSNYFRHMLSNEDYKLLKYPYYQPPLVNYEDAQEFNLAIKLLSTDEVIVAIKQAQYLSIVEELYFSHYLDWYKNYRNYDDFKNCLEQLLEYIKKEILTNESTEAIAFVQCQLFDDGQCPKLSVDNVTISRENRKKWRLIVSIIVWIFFAVGTFVLCVLPIFSKIITDICSFFTIIAGIMTIISFRKEF